MSYKAYYEFRGTVWNDQEMDAYDSERYQDQ